MSQAWYLRPQALAIIAQGRPAVQHFEKTYVLTTDRWSEYVGPQVEALVQVWTAGFLDDVQSAMISPQEVLGAVFGDAAGGPQYRTHFDNSAKWADIRDAVTFAMMPQAA